MANQKVLKFPDNFLWGAVTSAYQVEGANTNNDWWQWEQLEGKIADHSRCGLSANHYHLYQEDFDIAKELGHNAHRFSLEWSRIEPEEGQWCEEAFDHYRRVIAALKQRRITPIVTLWHFTLPFWLAEKGGFENPQSVTFFERYAAKVVQALGEDVDYWLTVNEPMVYLYSAYLQKAWPPGKNIGPGVFTVLKNIILAHRAAYQAIHQASRQFLDKKPLVGLTAYIRIFQPSRQYSFLDRAAARFKDYYFNDYFLKKSKGALDYIGLDYYTRELTRLDIAKPAQLFKEGSANKEAAVTDLGWEIYPQGIYLALVKLKNYGLPIIITENGLADGADSQRAQFILNHLIQVHRAIEEGIDVRGYLHWSLLDNFEWAEGFRPRFGLVEVDYATQRRRIRVSAHTYAKICKTNAIFAE